MVGKHTNWRREALREGGQRAGSSRLMVGRTPCLEKCTFLGPADLLGWGPGGSRRTVSLPGSPGGECAQVCTRPAFLCARQRLNAAGSRPGCVHPASRCASVFHTMVTGPIVLSSSTSFPSPPLGITRRSEGPQTETLPPPGKGYTCKPKGEALLAVFHRGWSIIHTLLRTLISPSLCPRFGH